MHCLVCRENRAYNRVVVDAITGDQLGNLCIGCQKRAFDGEFADPAPAGTVLCARDGFFAVPEWEATLVVEDGRSVSRSRCEVTANTPRLCGPHLDSVVTRTGTRAITPPTGPRPAVSP